jgi:hypothetical protein
MTVTTTCYGFGTHMQWSPTETIENETTDCNEPGGGTPIGVSLSREALAHLEQVMRADADIAT